MKVKDLMTLSPTSAEPDTTVEEIATMMKDDNIGCVPVIDEDGQVAGVITDRDIVIRCIAEGKDPAECRADDIISPQSICVSPNTDSREAAHLMADRQIRRLPVVENGKLVGMLSLGDVAVKEHDDRLSGDVLQDVSEGVKNSSGVVSGEGSDAREIGAQQGGSRSGVKTSTANRTQAGRSSSGKTTGSQQNFSRQKISNGISPEESLGERFATREDELSEDARPSAAFDSGRAPVAGITNRRDEEALRQDKVLPFREREDLSVRAEANRTREESENRAPKEQGRGRKKIS
ncbi:MAG TPA: CBS domain-containing protein [Terriglobales bacterium]|nr:CBS domain-containing protein [Terriglobales bacterium]